MRTAPHLCKSLPSRLRARQRRTSGWGLGLWLGLASSGCVLDEYRTTSALDGQYVTGTATGTGTGQPGCPDGLVACADGRCVGSTADCLPLELVSPDGWVGGDAATTTDDPAGIQGTWYAYGDGITCSPPALDPCGVEGCCIDWATSSDPSYASWGCGLGLELGGSGSEIEKRAYTGTAIGFVATLTGSSAPNPIRITFPQNADNDGEASPFVEVPGPGSYSVRFEEARCPSWGTELGCPYGTVANAAATHDIQFQIPGGDAAGNGRLCVASLVPILP